MKKEEAQALFSQFEQVSYVTNGVDCWTARELCYLLGYTQWRNFLKVIDKAKESCKNADHESSRRKTKMLLEYLYLSHLEKVPSKQRGASKYLQFKTKKHKDCRSK